MSDLPAGKHLFGAADGIATIGFALAIALIGVIAVPLSTGGRSVIDVPAPPAPAKRALTSPAPTVTAPEPVAQTPPHPPGRRIDTRRSAIVGHGAIVTIRHAPLRHQASVHRPKQWPPRFPATAEAPHLTGAALRKALAEDAVITRRLNLEALRKLP